MTLIQTWIHNRRVNVAAFLLFVLAFAAAACGTDDSKPKPSAQQAAQNKVETRVNYEPKNDVEGNNYNARQAIADNPATIIWCSAYPTNPSVKPFTVPIVGKLTSGNKRPYATSRAFAGGSDQLIYDDFYTTEVPGPDGFFGSSGEYRYGFDPAGNYYDFYNVETICTTVPDVIQKQTTDIAITTTGDLSSLDKRAEAAMATCRQSNTDPSVPCPEAAAILGVEVQR